LYLLFILITGRKDLAFVSANSSGDGIKFLDGVGVKSEHELNGTGESSDTTTTPVAELNATTMSHEELLKNLENENVPIMVRERLKMRLKLLEKSGEQNDLFEAFSFKLVDL
jgi:hypothetical protein